MSTLTDLFGIGAQGYNAYQISDQLQKARDDVKSGFDQGRADVQGAYQPYTNFGLQNIQGYQDLGPFSYTGQDMYNDPSYDWRFQQGQKALERTTAKAPQGFFSGQTLADITNYGQNAASQEYQAAFDRAKGTYDTNKDYYGFGVTTGAKAAGEMGTNLADIAIGRGGSLASLHGIQAGMMTNQLNALSKAISSGADPVQAVGDFLGSIGGTIDKIGNIISGGGAVLGNIEDILGVGGQAAGSVGAALAANGGFLSNPVSGAAAGNLISSTSTPVYDALAGGGFEASPITDPTFWDQASATVGDWGTTVKDFIGGLGGNATGAGLESSGVSTATGLGGFMSTVAAPMAIFLGGMDLLFGGKGSIFGGEGTKYGKEITNAMQTALKQPDPFKYILDYQKPQEISIGFTPESTDRSSVKKWDAWDYKGQLLGGLINSLPPEAIAAARNDPNIQKVTQTLIRGLGVIPRYVPTFGADMEKAVDGRTALKKLYPTIDTQALDELYNMQRMAGWKESFTGGADPSKVAGIHIGTATETEAKNFALKQDALKRINESISKTILTSSSKLGS